jgi:acyl-CoA synthetase (NDP forming)
MIASASSEQYRKTIEVVAADKNIDALIVCFTPPLVTRAEDVGQAIVEAIAAANIDKPILAVFLSEDPRLRSSGPTYALSISGDRSCASPRGCCRRWREDRNLPWRTSQTCVLLSGRHRCFCLQRGDGWLAAAETSQLLSCYGLPN